MLLKKFEMDLSTAIHEHVLEHGDGIGKTSITESEEDKEMGITDEDMKTGITKSDEDEETGIKESEESKETVIKESEEGKETSIKESEEGKETGITEIDEDEETGITESEENKDNGIKESEEGKETSIQESGEGKETGITKIDEDEETGIKESNEDKDNGITESEENKDNGIKESDEDMKTGFTEIDEDRETGITESDKDEETGITEIDEGKETDIKEHDEDIETGITESDEDMEDMVTSITERDEDEGTVITGSDEDNDTGITEYGKDEGTGITESENKETGIKESINKETGITEGKEDKETCITESDDDKVTGITEDDAMDDDDIDTDFIPPSDSSDTDESAVFPLLSGDVLLADSCQKRNPSKTTDKCILGNDNQRNVSTEVENCDSPVSHHNDQAYKVDKRHLYKDIIVAGYEKSNGRRNYAKQDFCFFCKNEYKSKISKHLLAIHRDEPRIKEIIDEPIHSRNRKLLLTKIQNEGNYQHNVEVLQKGKGVLIVKRRPDIKNSNSAIDYVPCEFCLAFIKDDTLWIHAKTCSFKQEDGDRNFLRNGRTMIQNVLHTPETDNDLVELFSKFKETSKNPGLKKVCENDELICFFASNLIDKLGTHDEQRRKDKDNIRTKIRSVRRLLKKLNENKFRDLPLSSYIKGNEFENVINAVKTLSIESNSPNLALTLGHYLKQICLLKISLGIQGENPSMKQEATDFQQLYNAHWNSRVSAVVLRRLRLRQMNKKIDIPCTEDLVTFKHFLSTELKKRLPLKPSLDEWVKYAEILITRLVLFNKRRISEVEELKITDFQNRLTGESANDELMDTSERVLAKRMDLIEVRGKSTRGLRKVYILLEPDMVQGIEQLLMARLHVGINPLNKYVFGRSTLSPLDGCTAMRNAVDLCPGLKKPNSIRSTLLRRYLATISQLLDMTGDELKMVADHMGHSIAIHTDIYRTMTSTIERTKVARALIALENGTLQKFQGRHLNSIDIEEIPLSLDNEDGLDVDENPTYERGEEVNEVEGIDIEEMPDNYREEDEAIEGTSTVFITANSKKRLKRKTWSDEENLVLKQNFVSYLNHENPILRNEEIKHALAKFKCLRGRTLPQIRSKLNNIKLGKSK